jgi:hypothetical protein
VGEQAVLDPIQSRQCSSSLGSLAGALAKAQGEMEAASKANINPHFKSKYADLASVWDACRLPLSKHGLAVLQPVRADGPKVTITTLLVHASGEWISESLTMTAQQNTPQAVGSAITYGRRYGLSAMVGIAPDDDDGNAASQGKRQAQPMDVSQFEEEAVSVPPGYEDWLADLAAVAEEGTARLQDTWKKSKSAYRSYLTSTNAPGWERLKAIAGKADRASAGVAS